MGSSDTTYNSSICAGLNAPPLPTPHLRHQVRERLPVRAGPELSGFSGLGCHHLLGRALVDKEEGVRMHKWGLPLGRALIGMEGTDYRDAQRGLYVHKNS